MPCLDTGERKVLSPHPNDPSYRRGDLRLSLAKESLAENLDAAQKQAVIIVHPSGHGSEDDLSALQDDMRDEGFAFRTLDFTLDRTQGSRDTWLCLTGLARSARESPQAH